MVTIATSSLINGISIMVVDCIAAFIGVRFLVRYFREKKSLMPYVSMIGFFWVVNYLGSLVTFWTLVITGTNIDPKLYFLLSYTIAPIAILNAVWLGFTIFNPERKKKVFAVYLGIAVVWYIAQFGFTDSMFRISGDINQLNATGTMVNIALGSVLIIIALFYIISIIFVLGGGFYALRNRITGIDRKRAIYVSIAHILFGIASIIEAMLGSYGDIIKIIARTMMATYLVLIYLGFSAKATAKPDAPEVTAEKSRTD